MRQIIYGVASAILALQATALPAQEKASPAMRLRPLETRMSAIEYTFRLSEDGRFALAAERGAPQKFRFGLWDVTSGKLLRFMAAEKGKSTKPYSGNDSGDFGAKVDFDELLRTATFSPDGKLVVGLSNPLLVWDVATGRLLHKLENRIHHPHTFRFINNREIVAKYRHGVGVELINAWSGQRKTLLDPNSTNAECYGGGRHGDLFTLVNHREIFSLSLTTGHRRHHALVPSDSFHLAPSATWYNREGTKFMIQREGRVEVWNTSPWTRHSDTLYAEVNGNFFVQGIARSANLLALRTPEGLELWDVVRKRMRTRMLLADDQWMLHEISADASRMIFSRRRPGTIVVEFEGTPGEGVIDLAAHIAALKTQPTR